ncbi:MAG: aspartate/glutamate racemase family protein [bacterium]|nr:aspartate/glutamate racemase family protein [bacterium]
MKTIGLIGGMSWESTITYYEVINTLVKERLGGFHSAKIMMYSVDFHELEANMETGNWDGNAEILTNAALNLEKAGADFILICTNTMHKLVPQIKEKIHVPILHIADATADALKAKNIHKAILLGTKFTMEQEFVKDVIHDRGIEILIPTEEERYKINDIIFNELCLGKILPESKAYYLSVIDRLTKEGGEAAILGCTEIGLLINQKDTDTPLFDTTIIHATAAVDTAL